MKANGASGLRGGSNKSLPFGVERRVEGVAVCAEHVEVLPAMERQVVEAVGARPEKPLVAQSHSRSGRALYLIEAVFECEVLEGKRGGSQHRLLARVGASRR